MSLLGEERRKHIIQLLDSKGKVKVSKLATEFNVSGETIRRDLDELEKKNVLKKVYGGAVKVSFNGVEPIHEVRQVINLDKKKEIGKKAAELVNDNEVIVIDVGTTTMQMIPHLMGKKNLTILSNSFVGINLLIKLLNEGEFTGEVIFIGGKVNSGQFTVYGTLSEIIVDMFYPDKAFIAVGGLCIDSGINDYNLDEASLSRKIMKNSKFNIVLVDSSKLGVRNACKITSMNNIDVIICNERPPMDWYSKLMNLGIEWITV